MFMLLNAKCYCIMCIFCCTVCSGAHEASSPMEGIFAVVIFKVSFLC